jgi:UDP-N-acetyl-2-amino-2-deoxyglucuronate dehydrogenase
MANFALMGVGGYIAPRHLEAIKDLGHNLVAAFDTKDSVGIMDRFFPDCMFFTEFERFEGFVDSLKGTTEAIDYVSICTPNYLHASHIKFALRNNAHAICEKPLVLHVSDLDELIEMEKKSGKKVFTVLQLRVHDAILALKKKIDSEAKNNYQVELNYMTSRGQWYLESWKGDVKKAGGLSTNIGVHFFDMLTWIFGRASEVSIDYKDDVREKGNVKLAKANVQWELTIDRSRLPIEAVKSGKTTFRSIKIDGEEFEFSEGFTELHKRVYTDILNGKGYGLEAARSAIEIVEKIREK